MTDNERQKMIKEIIRIMRENGAWSLGTAWLIRMTDSELKTKYDEVTKK